MSTRERQKLQPKAVRSHEGTTSWMVGPIVSRHGIDSVRNGHPWIYRSHVSSASASGGSIIPIVTERRECVGWGVYDPTSPIAVRVWSMDPAVKLDAALFQARFAKAVAARRALFANGETTAYRLLNGEGDRTPGFVIDRYDDVAVLRLDGDGARAVAPLLLATLETDLRALGITTLLERDAHAEGGAKSSVRFGPPREEVRVTEHGVPFVVDLLHGQKTGAFLDQRENRWRIGELVRARKEAGLGVRVLNLFSYTGGFSMFAARAGGVVTSVDIAPKAHVTAQESFRVAGLDPRAHTFVSADAFAWLEAAKKKGMTWDVVISDPPSFAPSEKAKPKAISAYRSLHRACVGVLAEGGHFAAASCSSHVSAEDFLRTLDDVALGRGDLRLQSMFGPPDDHPTLPSFPEGRYLKLAFLA